MYRTPNKKTTTANYAQKEASANQCLICSVVDPRSRDPGFLLTPGFGIRIRNGEKIRIRDLG
jgi:hypothetical protein